ncbi:hypothetical protein BROUX41_006599 [Berkeleyomyces rouxiae]|uniref:uncharacterized protein n=1 Tax=Berkeleyomyces rouxiae TaxID=2035830 RepID=UPI003B77FED0
MPPSSSTTAGPVRTRSLRAPKAVAATSTSKTAVSASTKSSASSARHPALIRRAATGTPTSVASVSTSASVSSVDVAEQKQQQQQHSTTPNGLRPRAQTATGGSRSLKLFLANLRALDLDLQPDWPDISALVFISSSTSSAVQKKRVQSVEWALFYLFKLWDPEECRTKLQSLFPPTDQAHSLALRAALLRCLEQAKKTGALGREILLRKTMLDDCKGERLEEVLAVFSAAVLKKVTANNSHGLYSGIAQSISYEERGSNGEREEMAALILAHKASLSRHLREKEEARALYHDLSKLLDAKEDDLIRHQDRLQTMLSPDDASHEQKIEMSRLVRNNWAGNERWMKTLLHSEHAESDTDPFFSVPFDRVWRLLHSGRLDELKEKPQSLFEELDSRIRVQQERLARWQDLRERIFGNSENKPITTNAMGTTQTPKGSIDLEFTAHHKMLHVSTSPRRKRTGSVPTTSLPVVVVEPGEYSEFIEDFYADFASAGKAKQTNVATQLLKQGASLRRAPRAPPISREATTTTPRKQDNTNSRLFQSPSSRHIRSMSVKSSPRISPPRVTLPGTHPADPTAPEIQLRPPEPSPEKAIKRPVRVRRGDETPSRRPEARRVPSPKPPPKIGGLDSKIEVSTSFPGLRRTSSNLFMGTRSMNMSSTVTAENRGLKSAPVPNSPLKLSETTSIPGNKTEQILDTIQDPELTPTRKTQSGRPMTLAERTRLSIMKTTSLDLDLDLDAEIHQTQPSVTIQEPEPEPAEDDQPLENLVARTRKSMAGFEAAQKKAQVDRRRSLRLEHAASKRGKERPRFEDVREEDGAPGDGDELNHEMSFLELMDADEDYEAVFRSRPKIKTSPAPSPSRMGFGG